MDILDCLLMLVLSGVMYSVCFVVGARIGQKVHKGEPIEMPKSPVTIMREHQQHKAAEAEKTRIEAILHNIDSYDGTGNGQHDVPRG